jgi:ABC-type nitrate/sulfonate/bicarbonate transport system permease component
MTVPAGAVRRVRRLGRARGLRAALARPVLGAGGLLGFGAVLEIAPRIGLVSPRYLPPASATLAALGREAAAGAFWRALLDTAVGWALGLTVAVAAATVLGALIGSVRALRVATASTIEFLRPIPSVALIPIAVLLWGAQLRSSLLLVVYAAFWPTLLQVIHGVGDVDPVARDTARAYRFTRWATVRHVLWPTALPYLLTGLRLSAAVALILAITAELVIGAPGLGKEIGVAMASSAVPAMYALILVVGLFGVAVNAGFRALERRALAWHRAVRAEVGP